MIGSVVIPHLTFVAEPAKRGLTLLKTFPPKPTLWRANFVNFFKDIFGLQQNAMAIFFRFPEPRKIASWKQTGGRDRERQLIQTKRKIAGLCWKENKVWEVACHAMTEQAHSLSLIPVQSMARPCCCCCCCCQRSWVMMININININIYYFWQPKAGLSPHAHANT